MRAGVVRHPGRCARLSKPCAGSLGQSVGGACGNDVRRRVGCMTFQTKQDCRGLKLMCRSGKEPVCSVKAPYEVLSCVGSMHHGSVKPHFFTSRGGSAEGCQALVARLLHGGNTLQEERGARFNSVTCAMLMADSNDFHSQTELLPSEHHPGRDRVEGTRRHFCGVVVSARRTSRWVCSKRANTAQEWYREHLDSSECLHNAQCGSTDATAYRANLLSGFI